jgi:peptidyl-prolyl cis-trans isomerase SurA
MLQRNTFYSFFYTLCVSMLLAVPVSHGQIVLLDSIAAVVDDDVVMTSELNERVESIYQRIAQSGTEAPPKELLVPQVLERLIIERIQLAMGKRAGVKISEAELNQAMATIAQNQGLSLEQFIENARNEGFSIRDLSQQLMSEMIISRVQEAQVNRRIFISEQEINNFLGSDEGRSWSSPDVNLGHILLPLSSGASQEEVEETESKARMIAGKLEAGEDFRSMAISYSADQTALQGGDLGWRKLAQLPDIFITALNDLEAGQVTRPIRSDAGIHLLKLYEKRGSSQQIIQQSKVRHILLKPNEIRDDNATFNEINKIAEQLRNGSDFAELAKEHSEDIGSALSGGDVGWSLPGKFVPEFENVLNTIPVNEISAPFRSPFGWHILQVTERRDQDFSDEIKRNQAENILRQRKFEEELQIWIQEIRDEAFVEIKV